MKKSGFTLIELLVVITIIGILAGLAFPALKNALGSADRAAASSSMRTIAGGVLAYASDNNDRLPGGNNGLFTGQTPGYRSNQNNGRYLIHHIWSYVGAPEPSTTTEYFEALMPPAYVKAYNFGQYSATGNIGPKYITLNNADLNAFGGNGSPPVTLSFLVANVGLSGVAMFTEIDKEFYTQRGKSLPGWSLQPVDKPFHQPRRGIAFFDGHVEMADVDDWDMGNRLNPTPAPVP